MSSECVILCKLTVNGRKMEDFKEVSEKEIAYYKQVSLMNKTAHGRLTPRYGVSLVYVPPSGEKPFAWKDVKNGTLIIIFEGGRRVTYSGVYILSAGERKSDGENEMTQTIDLGAEDRIEE